MTNAPTTTDVTDSKDSKDPDDDLPLGTTSENRRMHTIIRRVCYVLLFGLVIEGALTFPLLAIWYGVPDLSPKEVCDELSRNMYSDGTAECQTPYPLSGPPFGGKAEHEGQTTSRDDLGILPYPLYPEVDFRELVKRHEACEEWRKAQEPGADGKPAVPDDYCNYISSSPEP